MRGNFLCVLSVDFFQKKNIFLKNSFRIIIRVSNKLDPEVAQLSVGPDGGPNCLQRLPADKTSKQRVIKYK